MNKKILVSLSVIGAVAAIAVGGTIAYFSDTETSTGNTFTAGTLDLKIDSTCSYNGATTTGCTWGLKDLNGDVFFNYGDVKPGDSGENTISLHVQNDAYVCAEIKNLANDDNGLTEPESALDTTSGAGQGELAQKLVFTIWKDTNCDNILNNNEVTIIKDQPAINGLWPIADSRTAALLGGSTTCLGVAWSLPATVGNEVQSDSLKADVVFTAIQARNNGNFVCGQERPIPASYHISLENKNSNWQVLSGDNTYGDIQYSSNYNDFRGVVTGAGLVPNGKYQITLNGPGVCTFTDNGLAHLGPNAFSSGYWNNNTNLESTCGTPGEGVYNMNLISDWYTVIANASGTINYTFNLALPAGNYSGVKVLVKKMLDTHVSPWADTGTGYPAFNLYETASISFTVL